MDGQLSMETPTLVPPPYTRPTMDEVRAVSGTNGYNVVSTFSGAGGSCLGFRMAGFNILWASEFVPAAAETYAVNFPETPLDTRDIRKVDPAMILDRIGLKRGELDVLEGSPPCAAFSMAGNREFAAVEDPHVGRTTGEVPDETAPTRWGEVRKYSDVEQRVDDLFLEFARILDGLYPRVFVAENVPAILTGPAAEVKDEFIKAMEAPGYRVGVQVLNAAHYGVPQHRRRAIFVGVRRDQGLQPSWPAKSPYNSYTIRDALPNLQGATLHEGSGAPFKQQETWETDEPSPTILAKAYQFLVEEGTSIEEYAIGTEWDRIKAGESSQMRLCEKCWCRTCHRTGKVVVGVDRPPSGPRRYHRPVEMDLDQPSDTIRAGVSGSSTEDQKLFRVNETICPDCDGRGRAETCDECGGRGRLGYFQLVRSHPDRPVSTITQTAGTTGAAGVTHPIEKRKFTIDELKALSGFPPDFILTGTWARQWERIGRAVPPPMMAAIAATVRDEILNATTTKGLR